MADVNLSLSQMETIIHRASALALGYDIDNSDNAIANAQQQLAAEKIRLSWPIQGAPGWKISDDLVFVQITPEHDDYNIQRNQILQGRDNDSGLDVVEFNNCWKINWIFYGPNSYSRAMTLFINVYRESIREDLGRNFIYPIPNARAPIRAPELFAAQWWERVDLDIRFNSLVKIGTPQPYFKSVRITTENEEGDEDIVDIGY